MTLSESKQRLMNTPFAYSIVPIAPSQTSTRSSRAWRNGFIGSLLFNLLVIQRRRVDEQVRSVHPIDADGAHAFAHGLDEPVMVPAQVQPRLHRREHLVDGRLAGIPPQRLFSRLRLVPDHERPRGLVRHQDVDPAHLPSRLHLLPAELGPPII